MRNALKIRQLIFGEQGLTLVILCKEDNQYFHCPVLDVFSNDLLLNEFSPADIRLISYFAAQEELESDRYFLQTLNHD